MANTFKFGNGNWAVKDGYALAYNDENNNFKPLPFDFTRASSATTLNRQGLIETVGSGKPRIDFTDNTSGHLLLEPSRTNLLPYSNDFSNAVWVKNAGTTITTNYAISPDGSQNATRYLGTGASGLGDKLTLSSTSHTISIWVKSNTSENQLCRLTGDSNQVSSDILVTTEWNRIEYTFTASGLTDKTNGIFRDSNNNDIDILIWGAQVEEGSYATSYIPTEGSSVTRVAENTTTQDNVPSTVIGQTEGTVYAEFKIYETPTGTQRIIILSDGTGNERIGIAVGSGILYAFIVDGGTTQCEIVKSSFTGGTHKVAFGYKANDFVLYLNGVQVGTDNSGSVSSCDRIDLGNQFNANQLEGNIIDAKLYDTRLTNTELQNLTS